MARSSNDASEINKMLWVGGLGGLLFQMCLRFSVTSLVGKLYCMFVSKGIVMVMFIPFSKWVMQEPGLRATIRSKR